MNSSSSWTVLGLSIRMKGEAFFEVSAGYFMWYSVGISKCIKLGPERIYSMKNVFIYINIKILGGD